MEVYDEPRLVWVCSDTVQLRWASLEHAQLQSCRISFFWNGVLNCLPALRRGTLAKVITSEETLFWHDWWLDGTAPKFLWPEEFGTSYCPSGTVRDLAYLLKRTPFVDNPGVGPIKDLLRIASGTVGDHKQWGLTRNVAFSVKSFYNLNDGGLH